MAIEKTTWIGGEHLFTLKFGQIEALQDATDMGLEALANRFVSGDWKQSDLLETVRQGLLGGGLDAKKASNLSFGLAERGMGLLHFKAPALDAINNALLNKPDDFLGKMGATAEPPKPPESGNSAKSTGPLLKLGSPLPKSEP